MARESVEYHAMTEHMERSIAMNAENAPANQSMIIPVLTYHSVRTTSSDYLTVDISRFEQHIAYVSAHYVPVSLRKLSHLLESGEKPPERAIVVSFDDSLRNNIVHALPVLSRFHVRAVFFVIAGRIGQNNRWDTKAFVIEDHMRGEDLTRLVAEDHELGSHTMTHQRLTKLDAEEVRRELAESRDAIGNVVGVAPEAVSYPYGDSNDICSQICGKYFTFGFTTEREGVFNWCEDRTRIRRIHVSPEDTSLSLERKIERYRGTRHD